MIADPPISDARAKAEARRAKILAREAARLSAAKGEKQEGNNETAVTAENDDATPKGKDRPLAARRNLVKKASVDEEDNEKIASTENDKDSDGNLETNTSATYAAATAAIAARTAAAAATTTSETTANTATATGATPTMKITSQRTRDIEKEIVINNAKHDKAAVESISDKKIVVKKQVVKVVSTPLQPFQVMRFLRMVAIVVLAVITGYRSCLKNAEEVMTFSESQKSSNSPVGANALDEFLGNVQNPRQFTIPPSFYGNTKEFSLGTQQSRSWVQWLQGKVLTQTECTFSAVGVVWWASTVVSPLVSKSLPRNQKGMNIMNMVISFYNNGMEGVFDSVLSRIGELSLHLLVMVTTPMIMTSMALNSGFPLSGMGRGQEL